MEVTEHSHGLYVSVYRGEYDCTLDGVTSPKFGHKQVFLVTGDGPWTVADAIKKGTPVLAVRELGGVKNAFPVHDGKQYLKGQWAAGGNFVYTSDSRFPSRQPLSVHDRDMQKER